MLYQRQSLASRGGGKENFKGAHSERRIWDAEGVQGSGPLWGAGSYPSPRWRRLYQSAVQIRRLYRQKERCAYAGIFQLLVAIWGFMSRRGDLLNRWPMGQHLTPKYFISISAEVR